MLSTFGKEYIFSNAKHTVFSYNSTWFDPPASLYSVNNNEQHETHEIQFVLAKTRSKQTTNDGEKNHELYIKYTKCVRAFYHSNVVFGTESSLLYLFLPFW